MLGPVAVKDCTLNVQSVNGTVRVERRVMKTRCGFESCPVHSMVDNTCAAEGNKSIKHTETDRELAEELGIQHNSASTEWTNSLQERKEYNELKKKAEEIREKHDNGTVTLGDFHDLLMSIPEPETDEK